MKIKSLIAMAAIVTCSAVVFAQAPPEHNPAPAPAPPENDAAPAPPEAGLKSMSGVVAKVSADVRKFSLAGPAGAPTYTWNSDTQFTWNTPDKKVAAASDLKVDSSISGTYTVNSDVNVAKTVVIQPAAK